MKLPNTYRLHALRMANDAAGYDQDDMRARFDRLRDRHTNGTAPEAVSAYQLFQTPATLARHMAALLGIHASGRILEPSAGLARLVDAVAAYNPAQLVAVESDTFLAKYLFTKRSNAQLLQRDFLTLTPEETGLFDGVIMNPPFHMRADIRHTLHALKFLKPDGLLVGICMNTRHREEALKPLAGTWEPLPESTFRESGTSIGTVLFTIKKP